MRTLALMMLSMMVSLWSLGCYDGGDDCIVCRKCNGKHIWIEMFFSVMVAPCSDKGLPIHWNRLWGDPKLLGHPIQAGVVDGTYDHALWFSYSYLHTNIYAR